MGRRRSLAAIAAIIMISLPVAMASASSRVPVPEPADFALFALGVLGLLIGRANSRVRRRD